MQRDERHWMYEDYRQHMTTKKWKELLLNHDDSVIFHGRIRKLKARNLGAGVVEIYKVKDNR